MSAPTQEQIDEALNAASESMEAGVSKWPGMTYEQGVDATIRWMSGESDESPMSED